MLKFTKLENKIKIPNKTGETCLVILSIILSLFNILIRRTTYNIVQLNKRCQLGVEYSFWISPYKHSLDYSRLGYNNDTKTAYCYILSWQWYQDCILLHPMLTMIPRLHIVTSYVDNDTKNAFCYFLCWQWCQVHAFCYFVLWQWCQVHAFASYYDNDDRSMY